MAQSNKYDFIADALLERIAAGEITGRLPSVRALSAHYQVSSRTLAKALKRLAEAGYVLPGPHGTLLNPERRPRPRTGRVVLLTQEPGMAVSQFDDFRELAERSSVKLSVCALNDFAEPYADGYIFWGCAYDRKVVERMVRDGVPAVSVNALADNALLSYVDLSYREAFFQALNRLIGKGVRRVAFFHPMSSSSMGLANWKVLYREFVAECRDFQLKQPELDAYLPTHCNNALEFVDHLLRQKRQVEVIMQLNWHAELYDALLARGLRPGRDVRLMSLPIGVRQIRQWYAAAWELLLERRRDPYAPPRQGLIPVGSRFVPCDSLEDYLEIQK